MIYTIGLFTAIILLFLGSIALGALLLLFGLRWARVEEATFRDAFKASVIASLVCVVISLGQRYFSEFGGRPLTIELFSIALAFGTWLFVLRLFFGTNFLRSTQALLPTILSSLGMFALIALVFIPFIGECFVVPTGSMAPTIVGTHIESHCATCDKPAFIGAANDHYPRGVKQQCICADFHLNEVEPTNGRRIEGDRIIVAKFLMPKRWDIAAFKYPADPRLTYIKRLVGLPGETIHVENGSLFVDGKELNPPEDIANIIYSHSVSRTKALHGTADNPAVLGPDEYFFLGDNTNGSVDARFWKTGAPNHNPYAVPESYIKGVVTTIYWPPKRWRAFK